MARATAVERHLREMLVDVAAEAGVDQQVTPRMFN